MGIEYTLANHKDKTAFELGKGSWYALCDENRKGDACLLYKDSIYDVLINEVFEYQITHPEASELDVNEWKQYSKEIADKIFNFVNGADPSQISLCNDCDDSDFYLREQGYRWIGTRYENLDVNILNRHLSI